MSEELVKIKGGKSGLLLTFAPQASFEDVMQHLQGKLESGSGFFLRGTLVQIPRDVFTAAKREQMQHLFHEHGLICRVQKANEHSDRPVPGAFTVNRQPQRAEAGPKQADGSAAAAQEKTAKSDSVQEMMVVNRTLRGGQEIRTQSSVLVCGNVNPGSQIIAGGSIDVRGICRGLVHAGAFGDKSAIIVADRLMPPQIRIADLIARSPDHLDMTAEQDDAEPVEQTGDMDRQERKRRPDHPERALIRDGQIVIEPIER